INLNDLIQTPGFLSVPEFKTGLNTSRLFSFNAQHGLFGYLSNGSTIPTAPTKIGQVEVTSNVSGIDAGSMLSSNVDSLLDITPGQLGPNFKQSLSVPVGGTIVTPLFHYAGVLGQKGTPLYLNTLQSAFVPANGSPTEVGVLSNGKNVS